MPARINLLPQKWLKSGKVTKVTPSIRKFVAQFKGLDKRRQIFEIANTISKFEFKYVDLATMKKNYAKRTASKIINSKQILMLEEKTAKELKLPIRGCLEYANALAAALRASGIPAKVARFATHSFVLAYADGKWYKIELDFKNNKPHIIEISEKFYELYKGDKSYNVGLDSFALGIKSIKDFDKYLHNKS